MIPTITVESKAVLARFSASGIPESVRTNLRQMIPGLVRKVGKEVDSRIAAGLKSRASLKTEIHMLESPKRIAGRVRVVYQGGDKTKSMLPRWLESGTKAHPIVARNASALYFYWEKIGAYFIGPKVMHPGFPGIQYMEGAIETMRPEIMSVVEEAARRGASR